MIPPEIPGCKYKHRWYKCVLLHGHLPPCWLVPRGHPVEEDR